MVPQFRSSVAERLVAAFSGAFLLLALAGAPAPARAETFVIASGDGYGINDCLQNGSPCGRIVADAWCESHGLARATAFGPAEDVTGAVTVEKAADPVTPGSLIVTCEP